MKNILLTLSAIPTLTLLFSLSAGAASVTFQQGINGYAGTYDTWLGGNDYAVNFGNDGDLHVRHDTYGTYDDRTTLIKFDVSSLPAHAVINTATLSLLYYDDWNIASSDSLTVAAYRLIRPWTEGTGGGAEDRTGAAFYYQYAYPDTTQWYNGGARGVDHDRQASADASVTLYSITTPLWAAFSSDSIAASVAYWYANPSQNFGWVLDYTAYSDTMDGALFHSSEYSTSPADYVWRPKLDITYTVVPEPGVIGLFALSLASLLSRRNRTSSKLG